jgi:hypothetical protein
MFPFTKKEQKKEVPNSHPIQLDEKTHFALFRYD